MEKPRYTVSDLIKELQKYPHNMPVATSGNEEKFENILPLKTNKLIVDTNAPYYYRQFQVPDNEGKETIDCVVKLCDDLLAGIDKREKLAESLVKSVVRV